VISSYNNSRSAIEHVHVLVNRDRPDPERYASAQTFAQVAIAEAILALVDELQVQRSDAHTSERIKWNDLHGE
jgi:hypothetical protein